MLIWIKTTNVPEKQFFFLEYKVETFEEFIVLNFKEKVMEKSTKMN